jgi:acetoin utilization protein AcuB
LTARELISQTVLPVQTSDTGIEATGRMQVYHVRHLPIVNHEQFLGLIAEEDMMIHDLSQPIGSYRLSYLRPFCLENEHIFEVMAKVGRFRLTVIPVVDADENYLGVITMEDLLQYFASRFSFAEPGSILILEMLRNDYSLTDIARIAESDDIMILASFINSIPESNRIYVTLKLNRNDVSSFRASLERFGYEVAGAYATQDYGDNLKERYDALMSYLNI